ncbi:MAG: hypothetical protein N4A62_12930 [Marinisporobacter sp.]|nr:hypothetical protein [Marinisporobacter sp.]
MKNKINDFIYKKRFGFIFFALLSSIFNIGSIALLGSAHIYDIVHIYPSIMFYEGILTSRNPSEYYFIPLAVLIDGCIGIIIGQLAKKFFKKESAYFVMLSISFLIYWFIITFQFIFWN